MGKRKKSKLNAQFVLNFMKVKVDLENDESELFLLIIWDKKMIFFLIIGNEVSTSLKKTMYITNFEDKISFVN
jgi:hypothetical protein